MHHRFKHIHPTRNHFQFITNILQENTQIKTPDNGSFPPLTQQVILSLKYLVPNVNISFRLVKSLVFKQGGNNFPVN